MRKMEETGNLKKDVDNNHIESVKYRDLEYLKEKNGLFTTAEVVRDFDANTPESSEKNKRLYIEVRYAKNSCLSLKHTASVFRLKKDHKNLSSKEYVENLCQYLSDARNKTALTAADLSLVLTDLIGNTNMSDADNPVECNDTVNQLTISNYPPNDNPVECNDTVNQLTISNYPPNDNPSNVMTLLTNLQYQTIHQMITPSNVITLLTNLQYQTTHQMILMNMSQQFGWMKRRTCSHGFLVLSIQFLQIVLM